jgi:hypothetical protein
MVVSINMSPLHDRGLVNYYWIDLDDMGNNGKKTMGCSASMEFMENSGLHRIADEYREKEEHKRTLVLGELIYHFELKDRNKFFMTCLKWGLVEGEDFEIRDLSEEEVLKFAYPPDTIAKRKLEEKRQLHL